MFDGVQLSGRLGFERRVVSGGTLEWSVIYMGLFDGFR